MWVHWIQKGIDPEVWGQLFSFGLKEVGEIGARAFATFTLAAIWWPELAHKLHGVVIFKWFVSPTVQINSLLCI